MLRQILLILSGNAAASLLSLARNLLIARMISVEDYGVAASFALVVTLAEMGTALGLEAQIVQSKQGDAQHYQAALQGVSLLRGVIAALILLALSPVLAAFFGVGALTWAFASLALLPVFGGLTHLDIHRLTRARRFWPLMLCNALPVAISLIALIPLAILRDWRIMLAAIFLQASLRLILSHLLAERRWEAVFSAEIVGQTLRFGAPLMLNAALMFAVFQGDRLIVAQVLGLNALAIFSMGVTLTLTPTLVFDRSLQNALLAPLARGRSAQDLALLAPLAAGIAFAALMVPLANPLIGLLLGAKYADLGTLLPSLALWAALRMSKTGPSTLALARGQTANALAPNLLRALSLPLAAFAAHRTGAMSAVILVAVCAEALGFFVALAVLQRRQSGPAHLPIAALFAAIFGFAALGSAPLIGQSLSLIGAGLSLCALIYPLYQAMKKATQKAALV